MRADGLIVRTERPFNAETPLDVLCRSHVTPTELFFVRSHGDVPAVGPDAYRLTVAGDVRQPLSLSLREVRDRFPPVSVTATIACAGNRRSELNRVAPVADGIPWGPGAIGNGVWTGARLADVLAAAGVGAGARHAAFSGLDHADVEGRTEPFAGSIPIEKALAPEVLLAYELNGEALPPEHGFPLRVVVPGYVGARSVKWLDAISVQREGSTSFFQVRDYALGGEPLGEQVLNSAFCNAAGDVAGYALAGAGRSLERVEVSADGGRSWTTAAFDERGDEPWSWRLWRAQIDPGSGVHELVVRASDGTMQPEDVADVWNERGYMNNAWHRVQLT
jgi:sulfite oxidase